MMKTLCMIIAALMSTFLTAAAIAGDTAAMKPHVVKAGMVTATVTVEAIDLAKRVVTLKDADGNIFDLAVGDEVKNLPQVKVGDRVTTTYYEAISAKVYKPGEAPEISRTVQAVKTAKPGEKPSGEIRKTITTTATVTALDPEVPSVTLKGLDGKTVDVLIENPANIEGVEVGDEVVITYEEALAIKVETAK